MFRIIFVLFLLSSLAAPATAVAQVATGTIRVIDGDTLDVGRMRVRLYGIDAPEANQTCQTEQGLDWRCGDWVSREVRAQYQGRQARCEAMDTDRYGRMVARCLVEGRDIGQDLVAQGLAFAYRRYAMDYDLTEKQAAVAQRGLWAMHVQDPAAFRREGAPAQQAGPAAQSATTDCTIKGNISAKGERIYHMPGQRDYARTRINTAQGERWFCSAAEARNAGWRAALR